MISTKQVIATLRPTGFGRRLLVLSPTEKVLMSDLASTSIPKDKGTSTVRERDGGR